MSSALSNEILDDYSPLVIRYKDGRVERRMDTSITPPSFDPDSGVQSKDIIISPDINLSARIFLPKTITPACKLPLLVFFHGGAFVLESAFSSLYTQRHLNLLTSKANVIAVSVNYRLAPEHFLPVAFDDSWTAVKWIFNEARSQDSWIQHFADFDRVYFGGDSAGGTIAHNMAMRFRDGTFSGVNLRGMFLNSPYFLGEERIGKEDELYKVPSKFYPDDLWRYACPGTSGCDDPLINPGMDTELSKLGCARVLVYNGNDDFLKDRGVYYTEVLEKSGWNGDVEYVVFEGEGHIFDVLNPIAKNSIAILKKVGEFLNK